ncbi:MAG TPA: hypothetical protein VFS89_08415 [Nitrosospira sp.]|nr:hypothetical protein [Nitrosospira sp.]
MTPQIAWEGKELDWSLAILARWLLPYRLGQKALILLLSAVITAMLPRLGIAQVAWAPGASLCEANTGANGGQESSFDPASNQVRSRAEGGIAGTEHSSFAEVGVRFIPMASLTTKLKMEGIWPRGRLEGYGNINEGSYKARVILRDLTADTELGDQPVFDNSENGSFGAPGDKVINPFNVGSALFDVALKAGNEYSIVLRLETKANGLLGRSDFLSNDLQATFGCVTAETLDSDGDGLYDQWELSGIDVDGDGNADINLQALGLDYSGRMMKADPNHKDIFVEVDYFDCTIAGSDCSVGDTHTHLPMNAALDLIRQSFANASLTNPDGNSGINLWVAVDEGLPHQANCDLDTNCFDPIKTASFGTSTERMNANTIAAKKLVFHYNLWVHDLSSDLIGTSGRAEGCGRIGNPERGGNDFIVSLGRYTDRMGTPEDQAGTFMHELGHNLGLCHGGGDSKNCKPNYLSTMSYTWQFTGLQPSGIFDYSRNTLPTLKENNLNENLGIQDGSFITFYGPPDMSGNWNLGQGTGPIDWDLDGDPTDNPAVPSDINNLGIKGCRASPNDTLEGFDDWANLQFNFRDSGSFADGIHPPEVEREMDFETAQRVKELVWRAQIDTLYEYTAKLVCGVQNDPQDTRLARGFYATTINIHNPDNNQVKFFKKLALTYPPKEQRPGEIMPIGIDSLKHDEALKVDCVDIEKNSFNGKFPTPYIEGYVVIQSPRSLDVTGVYTSATVDENGRATSHSSVDVEQINERVKTVGLPDLIPAAPFPKPLPDEGFPGFFYCVKPDAGLRPTAIRVLVKNAGLSEAEGSTTKVEFKGAGNIMMATPKLLPGKETTLEVAIPNGCYPPDGSRCEFKITVDDLLQVNESIEKNNTDQSFCFAQ